MQLVLKICELEKHGNVNPGDPNNTIPSFVLLLMGRNAPKAFPLDGASGAPQQEFTTQHVGA